MSAGLSYHPCQRRTSPLDSGYCGQGTVQPTQLHLRLIDTSVLTVKKQKARKIDLRSPDEQAGKWVRDPDEIREQRRAARRLRAKKNKKDE